MNQTAQMSSGLSRATDIWDALNSRVTELGGRFGDGFGKGLLPWRSSEMLVWYSLGCPEKSHGKWFSFIVAVIPNEEALQELSATVMRLREDPKIGESLVFRRGTYSALGALFGSSDRDVFTPKMQLAQSGEWRTIG